MNEYIRPHIITALILLVAAILFFVDYMVYKVPGLLPLCLVSITGIIASLVCARVTRIAIKENNE